MDNKSLRSNAISNAIDAGAKYGFNQTDAAALLARVDNEFCLRGEENGGLVIDGYEYYADSIEECSQIGGLYDAVNDGKPKQECLDALGNEADQNVESFISGRMYMIVDDWMSDKGFDLRKEENWELQDKALEFLNDQIAIDFDRSYEKEEIRVNIIVGTAGEFTVGSAENKNQRQVQNYIGELVKSQGHSCEELTAAFDEYEKAILIPDFSDANTLYKAQCEKYGKFIASLASEIANSDPFNVDEFAFLAKMSVEDYAKLGDNATEITIPASTICGMYTRHDGSGSLLEVELEKPVTVSCEIVTEKQIENRSHNIGDFYTVDDCYGLIASCWDKGRVTVKEPPCAENAIEDYDRQDAIFESLGVRPERCEGTKNIDFER